MLVPTSVRSAPYTCSDTARSSPTLCTRWMSPGGNNPATIADVSDRRTGLDELIVGCELVAGLVLGAQVDADDAPREVVVDRSRLARQPDERHQGEAAVRRRVEQVLAIGLRVADQLVGSQQVRCPQSGLQGRRDGVDLVLARLGDVHRVVEVVDQRAEAGSDQAGPRECRVHECAPVVVVSSRATGWVAGSCPSAVRMASPRTASRSGRGCRRRSPGSTYARRCARRAGPAPRRRVRGRSCAASSPEGSARSRSDGQVHQRQSVRRQLVHRLAPTVI